MKNKYRRTSRNNDSLLGLIGLGAVVLALAGDRGNGQLAAPVTTPVNFTLPITTPTPVTPTPVTPTPVTPTTTPVFEYQPNYRAGDLVLDINYNKQYYILSVGGGYYQYSMVGSNQTYSAPYSAMEALTRKVSSGF